MTGSSKHRVVLVGGGFAGLYAAKRLGRAAVDVTVVDKRNFHVFQPLLYQVATGALSPGEIASPLRYVLNHNKNTRTWMAEVTGLDVARRRVILADGELPYDTLVLAAGARHHYFGNDQWERIAPGLKTIEDATEIRGRIFRAFEFAEREPDAARRRTWLTFVVVGGGPTGVELAGALGEIANDTLRNDFRTVNPKEANILLLEGTPRILGNFPVKLSDAAERSLIRLGVRTRVNARVTCVDEEGVLVSIDGRTDRIESKTVLWAAGVAASPLGKILADQADAQMDRAGRILVAPDLTVPGHPEIFVIGDMANFSHQTGNPLPGVAPVAMQQGRYTARLIQARLAGRTLPPFHYVDKGNMATIGRAAAVADIAGLRFSGILAWLAWLFIHLMYLVEFDNRLLVMVEWAYNYFTFNRGARLITGGQHLTAE